MRLLELWSLFEGKEQYVINTFGDKLLQAYKADPTVETRNENITADEITHILAEFDPTKNNKFLVWIAKMYADRQIKSEDLYKLPDELVLFAKVQNKLEVKDIMRYSGLPALAKATMEYEGEEEQQSNKQKARNVRQDFIDNGEAVVVYSTATLKIVHPKTKAASCEFGKGTKWCTAATGSHNYFDDYDDLYIVYPKPPVDGSPFQFDIESPDEDEDEHDEAPGGIGMVADVYDDHVTLANFIRRVPEVKKFITGLVRKGKINFWDRKSYEELYGKKFTDLPKNIKSKWLISQLMHKISSSSGNKKAFIEEFNRTFNEKERLSLFRKQKARIINNAARYQAPKTSINSIRTFFGQKAIDIMTEKDLIHHGQLYRRRSGFGNMEVPTAIKQYMQHMPNFNPNNVYKVAAESFTNLTNDSHNTEAIDFIGSSMKYKKDHAAVIQAYSGKKTQMKLAEIISDLTTVRRAEWGSPYHTKALSLEMITQYVLTDPAAIDFAKERLKDMFSKVKAKIKIQRGEENPTQTSIRYVYDFIGNKRSLGKLPPYEISIHDRVIKELEDSATSAIAMEDDVFFDDRLNLQWVFEDQGNWILSGLGISVSKIPNEKDPGERLGETFALATKNSLILIYRARERAWLLQIPYTGKLTNSGKPGYSPEYAKLYDAKTVNVADNIRQDIDRILEYLAKQQSDVEGITVDTDRFTESKNNFYGHDK